MQMKLPLKREESENSLFKIKTEGLYMKKKRKLRFLIVGIILVLFLFSSCAPITRHEVTMQTAKSMDIYGAGFIQQPILAELEIDEEKFTGSVTKTVSQSNANRREIENLKQRAVANALEISNADVLVEPSYKTFSETAQDDQVTFTTRVTGFPVIYKAFRPITDEDLDIIEGAHKYGNIQVARVSETFDEEEIETKRPSLIGLLIGGLAALIILIIVT